MLYYTMLLGCQLYIQILEGSFITTHMNGNNEPIVTPPTKWEWWTISKLSDWKILKKTRDPTLIATFWRGRDATWHL